MSKFNNIMQLIDEIEFHSFVQGQAIQDKDYNSIYEKNDIAIEKKKDLIIKILNEAGIFEKNEK